MADDLLLNTNGNTEVDPAAEFLAREQDELAELGEDFHTDENDGAPEADDSGDLIGGSEDVGGPAINGFDDPTMAAANNNFLDIEESEEWKKTRENVLNDAFKKLAITWRKREEELRYKNWYEYLQHLQREGQLCKYNCVLLILLWIYRTKGGAELFSYGHICGRHLEKYLTWYARDGIVVEDLECDKLMNIVTKCGITKLKQYDYTDITSTRLEMINKVWKEIMSIEVSNFRVLILGRWHPLNNQIGHSVVCDLDTRNDDKVTIRDIQAEKEKHMDKNEFLHFVSKDGGMNLYTVDLNVLNMVLGGYLDHIHLTSETTPTDLQGLRE